MSDETIIFTDGACKKNPGPGGWAWVEMKEDKKVKAATGGEKETTNNRMELTAVIEAVKTYAKKPNLLIYSDSDYVVKGVNIWLERWKNLGWYTSNKKLVKNRDLWFMLDDLLATCKQVEIKWVKGHTEKSLGNKLADKYAQAAAVKFQE